MTVGHFNTELFITTSSLSQYDFNNVEGDVKHYRHGMLNLVLCKKKKKQGI